MVWNKSRKNDWYDCFEMAKTYFREHGNLDIPSDYVVDGVWLNKWLNEQRQILIGNRKGKQLTEEQIEKLRSIGFTQSLYRENRWDRKYAELKEYYDEHGDCRLPMQYTDSQGENLYSWLRNQRQYAKNGKMSAERRKLLSEIGAIAM